MMKNSYYHFSESLMTKIKGLFLEKLNCYLKRINNYIEKAENVV